MPQGWGGGDPPHEPEGVFADVHQAPQRLHGLMGCGRDVRELGGKENCRGIQGSAEDRKQGFTEAMATAPPGHPRALTPTTGQHHPHPHPRNPQGTQPAWGTAGTRTALRCVGPQFWEGPSAESPGQRLGLGPGQWSVQILAGTRAYTLTHTHTYALRLAVSGRHAHTHTHML